MVNPYAGEVAIWLDGQRHVMRLTLGALAEMETALEAGSLIDLVERFDAQRTSLQVSSLLQPVGMGARCAVAGAGQVIEVAGVTSQPPT